jgi:hypothetical protein
VAADRGGDALGDWVRLKPISLKVAGEPARVIAPGSSEQLSLLEREQAEQVLAGE